uniref:F-box and regulator of chromosome condensation repeat protein n=1 Tax=Pithovirus LCPAC202 TaxID=2506592 RepID=A0A481Z712_9VIRU|nr:MAG: F-box and regulator of chromosome condensation repeat protein [Pithovirus LCPAC202]
MDQSQNLSIDYLDLLPDEILLEILIKTDDLETLSGWCRTSKRINNICQDEVLWKRKYQKDFGLSGKTVLAEGETWGELYKQRILFGINSPISAGARSYGMIDKNGNLYMLGQSTTSGIELQVQLPFNPKEQHLVKFPTKVPPRVINISVSTSRSVAAAVTEDGKVYVWGINHADIFNFQDDIRLIRTPRELILPNNKKAIKIEVSKLGYIILFEDSSVYLRIKKHRINFQGTLDLKAIDVFIGDDIYAIITPDRKLYVGNDGNRLFTIKLAPKNRSTPIMQVVIGKSFLGGNSIVVLLTTGEVYTWNYGYESTGAIYGTTYFKLVRLPEPIVQISTGGKTFAALSKTGKLYMWGSNRHNKISGDEQNFTTIRQGEMPYSQYRSEISYGTPYAQDPVEISFGTPINFVSIGSEFTIAVSNDGMVNFWGTRGLTPE